MVTLEVKIPPDLLKQLEPARLNRAIAASTMAVAQLVRTKMMHYPGPPHRPVIWASAKQRRFYFAQRRKFGLPPGYTRQSDPMSQRLKLGWTAKRRGATGAIVSSGRTGYAVYVQSAAYQTAQHKATGWQTDAQVVAAVQASGDVERIAQQAITKELGL